MTVYEKDSTNWKDEKLNTGLGGLERQKHAFETNPSVSTLSCAAESTASQSREAILPIPAGFVSPPEQEDFDILDKVQRKIVVARTEVSLRRHCVFQFPRRKVQREQSESLLVRAAIWQEQRSCNNKISGYKWRKHPACSGDKVLESASLRYSKPSCVWSPTTCFKSDLALSRRLDWTTAEVFSSLN